MSGEQSCYEQTFRTKRAYPKGAEDYQSSAPTGPARVVRPSWLKVEQILSSMISPVIISVRSTRNRLLKQIIFLIELCSMSRFKRYRYVFSGMFFDVGYTCFGSCFSLSSRGRIDALPGVQGLLHGPVGKCA